MSEYWQKRFEMLEDARNKVAMGTVQSVTPAFDRAQAQIEKEINAWYARFANNNQISLQEAKKLLNTKELKEFRWDVEEYIKYGRQNALDQGKYYTQDGVTYLCIRDTVNPVYNPLNELVGLYVERV